MRKKISGLRNRTVTRRLPNPRRDLPLFHGKDAPPIDFAKNAPPNEISRVMSASPRTI